MASVQVSKISTVFILLSSLFAFCATAQTGDSNPFRVVKVQSLILWRTPHPQVESLNPRFPFLHTRSLSVAERRSLGEAETQVIYGEKVEVIEERDQWVKLRVASQKTERYPQGYEAWAMKKFLANAGQTKTHAALLKVRIPVASLYADKEKKNLLPLQLSYGTQLRAVNDRGDEVELVSGQPAFLNQNAVQIFSSETSAFDPQALIADAKLFLGVRYVWGGTSAEGFDCSGFIYRLFLAQGQELPRNASDQAERGIPIERDQIKAGDLVFFNVSRKSARVDHVGLAINEHEFIHSPSASSAIKISDLNEAFWADKFAGARRVQE